MKEAFLSETFVLSNAEATAGLITLVGLTVFILLGVLAKDFVALKLCPSSSVALLSLLSVLVPATSLKFSQSMSVGSYNMFLLFFSSAVICRLSLISLLLHLQY
jgi:hypothetical protein